MKNTLRVYQTTRLPGVRDFEPVSVSTSEELIDGIFVRQDVLSEGPVFAAPILIVPGRCHGWWVYQKWLSYFASRGWASHALSLRNHEGSRPVPDQAFLNTSLQDYVDDVNSVLERIGTPTVLIGHSLGGMVIQKAAENNPLVAALVPIASVGPSQLGKPNVDVPADALIDDREWYEERGDWYMASRVTPESPRSVNDCRGRSPVIREFIRCPVLIVGGENDDTRVFKPPILARFYQCEHMEIPGASHDLMLGPNALRAASEISRWLENQLCPTLVQATPDYP